MPLQLVTGPANAAKARIILEAARGRAAASPLLVVPTTADVEIYRRELAHDGAVLGVCVERFDGLLRELAFRGGVAGRTLTELQRERVAAAAIAATPLERLASAARTPGFAPALVAFAQELGRRASNRRGSFARCATGRPASRRAPASPRSWAR